LKDINSLLALVHEDMERVEQMLALLGELVRKGRSTPGSEQSNDVDVEYLRFLRKS